MKKETWIALGSLAVAIVAVLMARQSSPVVVAGSGSNVPSFQGQAPTFNFNSDGGGFMGRGNYPPINSCGCGRSRNGVMATASLSPVFLGAQREIEGDKRPLPMRIPFELLATGSNLQ